MSNRDTQFQGFAHMLLLQLAEENALALNWDRFFGELELTVARRAYDLAFHSVDYTLDYLDECGIKTSGCMGKRIIPSIPDMPELPDDDKRYAEMQQEEQE